MVSSPGEFFKLFYYFTSNFYKFFLYILDSHFLGVWRGVMFLDPLIRLNKILIRSNLKLTIFFYKWSLKSLRDSQISTNGLLDIKPITKKNSKKFQKVEVTIIEPGD